MGRKKSGTDSYDRERAAQATLMRTKRTAGREIGDIPPVENQARRDEGERSFRRFCELYFAGTFSKAWSDDHLRVLAKTERAVLFGDLFAMAMPRGSGKTSIVIAACLWALLTGEHEFVALIGSDEGAALELLEAIKTELETNPLLLADFPEVCFPIACLEGIPQRRLLYKGAAVRMEFTAKAIVLPNIPGSQSYEAVVRTSGITGRIRGMHYKRGDGRQVRPSLVIIDDPQTDESAGSVAQCATREKILAGAILGLAGPGQKISGIMPCTVIRPGDMADKILDVGKYPQWNGERTKMVYAWPSNEELLREYSDLRADCQRRGDPPDVFNKFWKDRQIELEAGASVAWMERKDAADVSAIQHAVNLRMDIGPNAFQAEYQNDPIDQTIATDLLSAEEICRKINGYERGVIPHDAAHLSAFIDVGGKLLHWVVCAWKPDFTGYVIDYGCWPNQRRMYYTTADSAPTIDTIFKGKGVEASIFGALTSLVEDICRRDWKIDNGQTMQIGRCLIDSGWGETTPTVKSFCRQSNFRAVLMPSKGFGDKAARGGLNDYKKQPGEVRGLNWKTLADMPVRRALYSTNFWKTFIHRRLLVPQGGPGCLSFFKAGPEVHRMIADHLHAEYPVAVQAVGTTNIVDEWQQRPNHPDNHFLDCLTGCCVAASMLGAALETDKPTAKKKKLTLAEMKARAS